MKGQILGVDRRTGEGQLAGEDGRRYSFRPDDWAHRGEPAIGLQVDFEPESSQARSIFPLPVAAAPAMPASVRPPRAPRSDRSKVVAALLALFLGMLGVHRFYLGRTASGVAMLLLTLTAVGTVVTLPWALVDCFRYLVMSGGEFDRRYGAP